MNNTDRLCLGCMNDNGGAAVCPICGYNKAAAGDDKVLDAGTWIMERYLLGRVIETTGEGITYIGWDNRNDNVVYIKEYFPQGLCERQPNKSVKITVGKEYEFNNGIMQFIELSKKTAELDVPSLMPVVETLEIGGTAYSIIKSAAGIPLREFLLRNGGTLKWEQAKSLFLPLINTLETLGNAGIYHGAISPETVIVGRDGRLHIMSVSIPALRKAGSELSAQVFPGFAALEQYDTSLELGAYTDVYGLAATLFRVLIGNPPMAANERAVHDNMSIPAKAAETIPPYVLTALANALQIDPANRTATMAAFKADISRTSAPVPAVVAAKKTEKAAVASKPGAKSKTKKNQLYAIIAAAITAGALLLIGGIVLIFTSGGKGGSGADTSSILPPSSSQTASTESSPVILENLYTIPNFVGMNYAEVLENEEWNRVFKITLKEVEFGSAAEGCILSQSIPADEQVKKGTEIEIAVSLGATHLILPDVSGMSEIDAYIALLEAGILKDNIEFVDKYEPSGNPDTVIGTKPEANTSISRFSKIEVYINTYSVIGNDLEAFE